MNKTLVCPIAFNEKGKIERVIQRLLTSSVLETCDVLVLDDASDDGTSDIISQYTSKIHSIKHTTRQGVGAAIRTVIEYAVVKKYDMIVIMAGNDKDDPNEIIKLLTPIRDGYCDFVQGSRYLEKNGAAGDMPLYRKWATRLHPMLMSLFTHIKITDSTNGFRAMHLKIFKNQNINMSQKWLNHYELEPYLLFKAIQCDFRFKEVSVTKTYPPKKMGYTKMKPITGWWSILKPVVYLGLGIKK